jgi:phosphoribosylformylglycinamidine synthase subunit PurSL
VRVEVFSRGGRPDGRTRRALAELREAVSPRPQDLAIIDIYIVEGADLNAEAARQAFSDPVTQEVLLDGHGGPVPDWDTLVEVTVRPGVTDPVALTAREALGLCLPEGLPESALVQTGIQYLVKGTADPQALARFFHNPLIQSAACITRGQWREGMRPPSSYPHVVAGSPAGVESIDLCGAGDGEMEEISRARLLALSTAEMRAVKGYFSRPEVLAGRAARGLPRGATDVELEMIAQTWSEHCKHKIFNATVHYREEGREETIRSLFDTFIRAVTEETGKGRPELVSVFHDNSGVVAFDPDTLLCFKVETHNSPSALDPYGGAITGIVGVNRDIMGTGLGARPIFNTDVLCFGPPDTPVDGVPPGLLHPRRVRDGVHRGIVDGGNQSGIPVVAGAILYDESFLGKPLVFCGTGGILPASVGGRRSWEKEVRPGDAAVMTGGRIGKDGIHGATFSSQVLSESSPTSAVQIGDPITQKRMLDFLLEARDLGLYRGLTDNGAGGLSSSLGEMADLCGGVRIDLDRCPLKYRGLAPWEILVSESQERMSLAVPPDRLEALISLARRRGVEATAVGEFTDSGFVEVTAGGAVAALVSLDFLHKGLPVMELDAVWEPPPMIEEDLPPELSLEEAMLRVLADPTVASKEAWVRQFDHEVQARSVVKPFVGAERDAPSDGAVLRVLPHSVRGITVTHGICPGYSELDTYAMAQCAVDEAVRAHVALGGDPSAMYALDNFCWPDPVQGPDTPDGEYKMAQLVRACRGLADACRDYRLPLISGKDSMKNDARIGGRKVSVLPTLLVSLMGFIPDVRRSVTTDFKAAGDALYVVGLTRGELGCTRYERAAGRRLGRGPSAEPREAMKAYRAVHAAAREGLMRSCHDLSDGGLAVALAECALGGRLGAAVDLSRLPAARPLEEARLLFSETPSRLLVSVTPASCRRWEERMEGLPCARVGEVLRTPVLRVRSGGARALELGLPEILAAWKGGTA